MRHLVVALLMALLLSSPGVSAASSANAYLSDAGGAIASVVDVSSGKYTSTVSMPAGAANATTQGVAMDPKGDWVYITSSNGSSGAVHALKISENKVITSLSVPGIVFGIVMNPDGQRLYVTYTAFGKFKIPQGRVWAINISDTGAMLPVDPPVVLSLAGSATGVVVAPSGLVYVASTSGNLYVIEPNLFGTSPNGVSPIVNPWLWAGSSLAGIAMSTEEDYLYVADKRGGRLVRVNVAQSDAAYKAMSAVAVGCDPYGVAVSPNGTRVYVTNSGVPDPFSAQGPCSAGADVNNFNSVFVVDAASMAIDSKLSVGQRPHGVAMTSDGARVYVVNKDSHNVTVLDTATGTKKPSIDLPGSSSPVGIGLPAILRIDVQIDIKPGSDQNTINLGSHGVTPVAILSTSAFDAPTRVNPATVTLAGAPVQVKGNDGLPVVEEYDVNGDGLVDLVVHVRTDAMQLAPSDTTAVLEGKTWADESIWGVGPVRIVPSK